MGIRKALNTKCSGRPKKYNGIYIIIYIIKKYKRIIREIYIRYIIN